MVHFVFWDLFDALSFVNHGMRVVTVDVEPSWFTGSFTSNNTKHVPSYEYCVKQKVTFICICVLDGMF